MNQTNSVNPQASGRGVIAVLGPTNTGKTHLAIERMVAHQSGLIGLPLRLLAREVYERVAAKAGAANVELVTGEEKINTGTGARFTVSTVEAMPDSTNAAFVAIDEVQMAADLERGHIFTDRILNLRGRAETLLLGAATVQRTLQDLLPGISVVTRPRMSMLTWAGQKKITRLPQRSAIVAFSAEEVYAIAELIRRQRGGAAVVLGSLSPRTRNAQVALYQSGDVDFLVATDAIGMGLNLDLDHVAFAQDRKFDGFAHRRLTAGEMGQIAGRAGRHVRNGTFGVTGQLQPFEDEIVERLETHRFDPVQVLVWRNRNLDYSGLDELRASLEVASANRQLMKSFPAADLVALDTLSRDEAIRAICTSESRIRQFWEVCQIPDYRRISPGEHAELLRSVFLDLSRRGTIDEEWFAAQVNLTDRTDGDMDALSMRIAHIRTWTYLSNRQDWIGDAAHWQNVTRGIEDRLSDALHEALTKRFIDRRTSVLMKRLRENAMFDAEITATGEVVLEGHSVGRLSGFRFTPDPAASGTGAKAASGAALKALAAEIARRAERFGAAPNGDIVLAADGAIRWLGEPVAKAVSGDSVLRPRLVLLADEQLTGAARDAVAARLDRWIANHVATLLKPLVELAADETLQGMARGLAFRLVENFGILDRRDVSADLQALDQEMRSGLRRHGVRFGAYHVFIPALLKPAPNGLICLLWGLKSGKLDAPGLAEVPALLAAGRTSFACEAQISRDIYLLCGFRVLGQKAVRIDILERLADLIRPALAWKNVAGSVAPDGAVDGGCFVATPAMLSILGATHEIMEEVLTGLGYRSERKPEGEVKALLALRTATEPKEIKPDGAAQPIEMTPAPADENAAVSVQSDTVAADPVLADAVTANATVVTIVAPDENHASAGTEETPAAAEPPKLVALWRPARRERTNAGPQRAARPRRQERLSREAGQPQDNGIVEGSSLRADKQQEKHQVKRQGSRRGERHDQKQDNRPQSPNGKDAGGKVFAGKRGEKPGQPKMPQRDQTPQRRIDPDSPFAKLAELKARLEKRNG